MALSRFDEAQRVLEQALELQRQCTAKPRSATDDDTRVRLCFPSSCSARTACLQKQHSDENCMTRTVNTLIYNIMHCTRGQPEQEEEDKSEARTAATLYELGKVLRYCGNMERAEATLQQALQMQRTLWPSPEHLEPIVTSGDATSQSTGTASGSGSGSGLRIEIAMTLHELGVLYFKRQDLARAEQHLQRSLALKRRVQLSATCALAPLAHCDPGCPWHIPGHRSGKK
eukprot:COSAG05_NODE_188_length_14697_cov_11.861145_12_plen_229_part_00